MFILEQDFSALIHMLLGRIGERPDQGLNEQEINSLPVEKDHQKG